ncbi:MAG: DUF1207 domain-containing protein [Fimbriiglobus sp.]
MRWHWLTTGFVSLALVAMAHAQSPAGPRITQPITAPSTGPGSHGWPTTESTPIPMPAALPTLEAPSIGLPAYTANPTYSSTTEMVVLDSEGLPPLPGSLEDNFNKEVAARRAFRTCTWNDYRISVFPTTLLWENGFADKRAPRLQLLGSNLDNYVNSRTYDSSIGTTFGLARVDTPGRDLSAQVDLFGVVHSRHSPDDLIASDYRFGLPISFRWGDWRAKIAYEHTSTHLGDVFMRNTGRNPRNYSKDEAVFGLMRDFWDLRVYGQVSYAFRQTLPNDPKPWRYDAGFQWVLPQLGSLTGAPYIAAHVDARGEVNYNPNVAAQVGWIWRNPFQRLANLRVFGEYYEGRSGFGQFAFDREKFMGIGIAADF